MISSDVNEIKTKLAEYVDLSCIPTAYGGTYKVPNS